MAYECNECGEVSNRGEYNHTRKCRVGKLERGAICFNGDGCDATDAEIETNRDVSKPLRASDGYCCTKCGQQWEVGDLGNSYAEVLS